MNNYLVGSGHFAVGFTLGFIIMLIVQQKDRTNLNVQLYFPLLPFALGIWASLPYLFLSDTNSNTTWFNIFILFDLIHHNEMVIRIFGRLNFIVVICGLMYTYILLRYIRLVKYCRRYGWSKGN